MVELFSNSIYFVEQNIASKKNIVVKQLNQCFLTTFVQNKYKNWHIQIKIYPNSSRQSYAHLTWKNQGESESDSPLPSHTRRYPAASGLQGSLAPLPQLRRNGDGWSLPSPSISNSLSSTPKHCPSKGTGLTPLSFWNVKALYKSPDLWTFWGTFFKISLHWPKG